MTHNQKRIEHGRRAIKAWRGKQTPDETDFRDCISDVIHVMIEELTPIKVAEEIQIAVKNALREHLEEKGYLK